MVACMHSSLYFPPVALLSPSFVSSPPIHVAPTAGEFFASWMSGCGQIYIASSPYSGALIVVGMAFYSRIAAVAMMLGSLIGLAAAYMLGASSAAIAQGLWGYNPALFMIAIFGVFFVPSVKVFILAVTGAFMSCFVSGALYTVLRPLGVPQLTFAFSFSALCFVLVQFSLGGVAQVPLAQVTTPESHWRKTRILRAVLRRIARK
jgi:urea transporter